jgi:hypothetical protein
VSERITWLRGARRLGPEQLIGVLEVKADGTSRAVFAERAEVDGRSHIRLARTIWEGKDVIVVEDGPMVLLRFR